MQQGVIAVHGTLDTVGLTQAIDKASAHRMQAATHDAVAARLDSSGKLERKGDHETAAKAHRHAATQYELATEYYKKGETKMAQQYLSNGVEASVWAQSLTRRAGLG